MARDRRVNVRLRAAVDEYQRDMQGAAASTREVGEAAETTAGRVSAAGDEAHTAGQQGEQAGRRFEVGWAGVATVTGAAAAAMEGLARSASDTIEESQRIASTTGMTRSEVQGLTADLSDATFAVDEVRGVLEAGGQQGLDTARDLEEFAETIDLVADGSGESAEELAEAATGLRTVGIAAGDEAEALDAFGFITSETTQEVSEFLQFLERTGPEIRELGADVDDAAALLAVMEEQFGLSGRQARQEFRSAINDSDGSLEGLLDTLGIAEGQFEETREQISGSGEALQDNADAVEEARTPWERLTAEVSAFRERNAETISAVGGLGSGFATATTSIALMPPALRNVRRAVRGVSGAMGLINPKLAAIGALAAAAGAAYVSLRSDTVDVEEAHWEFVAALEETEGQLDQTSDAAIRKRLEDEGLIEAAETLDVETRDLVDAVRGEEGAHRRVRDAIEDHKNASDAWAIENEDAANAAGDLVVGLEDLEGAFEGARREVIADELEEMGVSLSDLDHELRETLVGAEDLDAALDALPPHLRPVADGADDAGDAASVAKDEFDAMADEAEDAASELDTLRDAMEEISGTARDMETAHRNVLDAIEAIGDTAEDTAGSLDINTEAGRDNRAALQDAAEAVWDKVEAVWEETGSVEEATAAADEHYDSLLDEAEAAGISRDAAHEYLEELNLIPEDVETAIWAQTDEAEQHLRRVQELVDGLPTSRTVRVEARGDVPTGGGQAEIFHQGGVVGQSSVPTRSLLAPLAGDEVPAILQRGELVLSRDDVQRLRSAQVMHAGGVAGSMSDNRQTNVSVQVTQRPGETGTSSVTRGLRRAGYLGAQD